MRAALLPLVLAITLPGPAQAQVVPPAGACLHEDLESYSERQRRIEALRAAELIASLAARMVIPRHEVYPGWDVVARRGAAMGRMDGGPMGRLARKMNWDSREVLPGWEVHYVADRNGFSFSLKDQRDPCGFSYFTDDRGFISEGRAPEPFGVRPLESR